jgi:hypothetical protein
MVLAHEHDLMWRMEKMDIIRSFADTRELKEILFPV